MNVDELQQLLGDERERNNEHRRNFSILMSEHDRLRSEFRAAQNEQRLTAEEKRLEENKRTREIKRAKTEVAQLQQKMDEMRDDRMSLPNLPLLKLRIQNEIERVYQERFAASEEETELLKIECNKLRYELAHEKDELEHAQQIHIRILEETELKHEAQVLQLENDKTALQKALDKMKGKNDDEKIVSVMRENSELQQQNQILKAELEELQARRNEAVVQLDNLQRLHSKENSQNLMNHRTLELEISSLKNHVKRLENELKIQEEKESKLTDELQSQIKTNNELHSKLKEIEYKGRVEVANVKMEMAKQQGENDRDRERMEGKFSDYKHEMDSMNKKAELQNKMMFEQEKEFQRQILALQDDEIKKNQEVEIKTSELQARIRELERMLDDDERESYLLLKMAEDKNSALWQQKENLEKELNDLKRSNVTQIESTNSHVEHENRLLRQGKENLESILVERDIGIPGSGREVEVERVQNGRLLINQQFIWEEQKNQMSSRISCLECQINRLHTSHYNQRQKSQQQLSTLQKGIVKLRNRIQLQKAKVDELEAEKEFLKKNVPLDVHRGVQKSLCKMQRKFDELCNFIFANDPSIRSTIFSDKERSLRIADSEYLLNEKTFLSSDLTRKELEHIQQRISILDGKQQKQMLELAKETLHSESDERDLLPEIDKSSQS